MEAYDLGPLLYRPLGQSLDPGKIVHLVVITMFELGSGDSHLSHWTALSCRSGRVNHTIS